MSDWVPTGDGITDDRQAVQGLLDLGWPLELIPLLAAASEETPTWSDGWEATIWSNGPKSWHARYTNGIIQLCDGPGCPWIDHARTKERIEKKARAQLASLNPAPPVEQYVLSPSSGEQGDSTS